MVSSSTKRFSAPCWILISTVLLSTSQFTVVEGTELRQCVSSTECNPFRFETSRPPCARLCPKTKPGPTCDAYYCFQNSVCLAAPACSSTECLTDEDCAARVLKRCAKCKAPLGPGCTTSTCVAGYCHNVEPCSYKLPPPKFTKEQCSKDLDCKLQSATCAKTCPAPSVPAEPNLKNLGPRCEKSYCYQNKCVFQETCGGKSCKKDSDCAGGPRACAKCREGQFPGCTVHKCANGFCHRIPLCSLSSPPTPPGPPDFVKESCKKTSDCKFVAKADCSKCGKIDGATLGPDCHKSYCLENTCVAQPFCGGKRCKKDADCKSDKLACATCLPGTFPYCTTNKCANGYCHNVALCSLKLAVQPVVDSPPMPSPSPFVSDKCKADADCKLKGPLICAGCNLDGGPVMGPSCTQTFCYNKRCVLQEVCEGKPCKEDAECNDVQMGLACRLCTKDKFPPCPVRKCANGFCAAIRPCSLG